MWKQSFSTALRKIINMSQPTWLNPLIIRYFHHNTAWFTSLLCKLNGKIVPLLKNEISFRSSVKPKIRSGGKKDLVITYFKNNWNPRPLKLFCVHFLNGASGSEWATAGTLASVFEVFLLCSTGTKAAFSTRECPNSCMDSCCFSAPRRTPMGQGNKLVKLHSNLLKSQTCLNKQFSGKDEFTHRGYWQGVLPVVDVGKTEWKTEMLWIPLGRDQGYCYTGQSFQDRFY